MDFKGLQSYRIRCLLLAHQLFPCERKVPLAHYSSIHVQLKVYPVLYHNLIVAEPKHVVIVGSRLRPRSLVLLHNSPSQQIETHRR